MPHRQRKMHEIRIREIKQKEELREDEKNRQIQSNDFDKSSLTRGLFIKFCADITAFFYVVSHCGMT